MIVELERNELNTWCLVYTFVMGSGMKFEANAESPQVSDNYRLLSKESRREVITDAIPVSHKEHVLDVVESHDDGSIYISCPPIAVSQRGAVLLELESHLKGKIDPAITVWLSPLGDRSALRKLRGVTINTIKKTSGEGVPF